MVKIDKSLIGYQFKSDKEDAVITVTKTGIEVSIGKDKRNRRGDLFRFDSFTKKDDHVYDSMITNQISFDKLMKDLLLDGRTGTVFQYYGYFTATKKTTLKDIFSCSLNRPEELISYEKMICVLELNMNNCQWGEDIK